MSDGVAERVLNVGSFSSMYEWGSTHGDWIVDFAAVQFHKTLVYGVIFIKVSLCSSHKTWRGSDRTFYIMYLFLDIIQLPNQVLCALVVVVMISFDERCPLYGETSDVVQLCIVRTVFKDVNVDHLDS